MLAFAAALLALPLPAQPPLTEIPIRLSTGVSTRTAKVADRVDARVIAGPWAAPGAIVHGAVAEVRQAASPDVRAALLLHFTAIEIRGKLTPLAARVADVDNARETVDEHGRILGIFEADTFASRLDAGIDDLARNSSALAGVLGGMKDSLWQPPALDIVYPPGVEMTLRLTAPASPPDGAASAPGPLSEADARALAAVAARSPIQTEAREPRLPGDLTNLLFAADEGTLRRAFKTAGWSAAAGLTPSSKMQTLWALAEERGYREAPVSVLLLDGRPPDLVFEKANNTIARRHHVRIWRIAETFRGRPLWLAAATHDTAIRYSEAARTFVHRIDSEIDRERAKIVDDLVFTGRVRGVALFPRSNVPPQSHNATGDPVETDGAIAAVWLR